MHAEAATAGRDPRAIEITVPYPNDPAALNPKVPHARDAFDHLCALAENYAEMGVTRMLLPALPEETLRAVVTGLTDRFGNN